MKLNTLVSSLILGATLLTTTATHSFAANCSDGVCACGDTIPSGSSVVLQPTAPVALGNCSTNPVLTIEDGASLDLNRLQLRCNAGIGLITGVLMTGADATLRNGAIFDGCGDAVRLEGAGGHVVEGVVLRGHSVGIKIAGSSGNKIVNNIMASNTRGIDISSGGDATLINNNVIRGGTGKGIYAVSGIGSKVTGNIVMGGSDLILVSSPATADAMTKNVAVGGSGYGILANTEKTISKNVAAGCNVGIHGGGGKVAKNTAVGNTLQGLELIQTYPQDEYVVVGNVASSNGLDGISVTATSVVIADNQAHGNADNGIDVNSTNVVLEDNTAYGNGGSDIEQ